MTEVAWSAGVLSGAGSGPGGSPPTPTQSTLVSRLAPSLELQLDV